jgi:hypothetical protein
VGSGDIVVNGGFFANGVRIIEALSGPVSFNNVLGQGHITLMAAAGLSGQDVSFTGGNLLLPAHGSGINTTGIKVDGGTLTFTGVNIGRQASTRPPDAPAWSATNGAHLVFDRCQITPPLGTADATSTVAIT